MPCKIFVNLPVNELPKAMEFFGKLGFSFNPHYTDETAACMVVSDDIFVMLLTHEKFKEFSPGPIADARTSTGVLVSLTCESRAAVDEVVAKAVASGARTFR